MVHKTKDDVFDEEQYDDDEQEEVRSYFQTKNEEMNTL